MTEPENFEEDLFADLYDDETPAKPAAAQDPAPAPALATAPVPIPSHEVYSDAPPPAEPDHGGEDQMKYEDEDEDDVDFNLGGGGGGGGGAPSHAPPSNGTAHVKHEEPTYSTSTAKNPSAKEDG